jgi:hypothetical protein
VVFAGEGLHHRLIHVFRNEFPQRRGVGQRIVEDRADQATLHEDIVGRDRGVDGAELRIEIRSEIREGSDQGAGADSRHQLKIGAVAGLGPTDQETGTERTVVAAARNGEQMRCRQLGVRCQSQRLSLALDGEVELRHDLVVLRTGKEARIGEAKRQRPGRVGGGHRRQTFGRGTAADRKHEKRGNPYLLPDEPAILLAARATRCCLSFPLPLPAGHGHPPS